MSDRSSNSNSSSESSDLDENYVPSRPIDISLLGLSRPVTRLLNNRQKENVIQDCRQSKITNKNFNSKLLVGTKDNIQTIESNNTMALPTSTTLSLETAIRLIPHFNGENVQEVYPFINACNFVMRNVDETIKPVLLQVIITKLSGKAFAITQHKEISTWEILRDNLEGTFCATRTPGYLQLELTTTKFQQGEMVRDYATRVEKLLHELCNVSTKDKSAGDAKAIHNYIKETTLTTYIEGLPSTIRGVVKSKNHPTLEEAIKDSLEEEKIYQSNKGTQRLLNNKPNNMNISKYCKYCRKTNHNTHECRFGNNNVDTGQQSKQSKGFNNQRNQETKQVSCIYCKKTGHTIDVCYKKKNADTRKSNNNNQPSTSGNGKEPGKAGVRLVRELKMITQN